MPPLKATILRMRLLVLFLHLMLFWRYLSMQVHQELGRSLSNSAKEKKTVTPKRILYWLSM
uniref:Uncharacterized protein n=1 Tax=Rhizophora mucronata TaxID=61149 RepID=A0A2P2MEB0_RHIMU